MKPNKLALAAVAVAALAAASGTAYAQGQGPKILGPASPYARVAAAAEAARYADVAGLPPGVAMVGQRSMRFSGNDRYETAVALSQVWEPDMTLAVYLASGENFPDALALGGATFGLGPVLLTPAGSLHPAVAAELDRLDPCMVLAAGGPRSLGGAVLAEADRYTVDCEAKVPADEEVAEPAP